MEEKYTLLWKNVSAWPKGSKNTKILDNVSGIARSGYLVGILSPSGGGKTTLLAILNKRFKGLVEGEILLNGNAIKQEQMSRLSGFVPQKDFAFETLTVKEHLEFMACLKMSYKSSYEEQQKIVSRTVEDLGLTHRLNVRLSSLSGGQRKKLSLAVQLLTEPKILFCDEPTTGLDSYSAISVIRLLRRLASDGKLIFCSIHQPASGLFELFDYVSLQTSNSSLAYYGPVRSVLEYFSTHLNLQCPVAYNVSEFLVSQVTDRNHAIRGSAIAKNFILSDHYQNLMNEIDQASEKISPLIDRTNSNNNSKTSIPFHIEFKWLLWRTSLLLKRASKYMMLRFLLYLMVMLCVSLPYGTIVLDQASIQNIQGLYHTFMLEVAYCSLYSVILTFPEEMPIFLQESSDSLYTATSYYISKIIVLFPKSVIEGFVYTNVVFTMTGLNNGTICIAQTFPLILVSLAASAYGFFLSTAFRSVATASLFSVPFESICCMYTGVSLRLRSLPWYTQWIKYISFLYYGLEALSIQRWSIIKHLPCQDEICISNGNEVLLLFGYGKANLTFDYFGLIVFFIVFHTLGYTLLVFQKKNSTPY